MFYFLTSAIDYNNSGIENAQMKRLSLFHKHNVPAKIATFTYARYQYLYLTRESLMPDDVVNLYDFFQNRLFYHGPRENIANFKFVNADVEDNGTNVIYRRNGQKVMQVWTFTDYTFYEKGQIERVEYYGVNGKMQRKDLFDVRGFLSSSIYYAASGAHNRQVFYDAGGVPVIVKQFQNVKGDQAERIWLRYHERSYYFDSDDELTGFFYDQLVKQDAEGMIADRSYAVDPGIYHMQQRVYTISFWHNVHTAVDAPLTGALSETLGAEMAEASRFQGLFTSTRKQSSMIAKRVKSFPIKAVPAGFVTDQTLAEKHVPFDKRQSHHIISVSRIHEQKRLEDTISAFVQIRQAVPDATLSIHGYINDQKLMDQLQKQADEAHLHDAVTFVAYTPDLTGVYNNAQLMLISSRYEGFGLALLEAQSHGVPAISYDVNYGPSDIIMDGKSGYIVKNGDIHALAEKAIALFKDNQLLRKLSDGAYKSAARFSEDKVWQAWQDQFIQPAREQNK
ncbi:glycosyltransferase [Lacticaseibacillus zeae]|uniref:glycosyltransferase n=1 Tax=Lacticaseibacillus zeae TaxID=57037 RepID=UPI001BCE82CC|nr:glycosyltransferase [Lacticaseibacillus zeae]QVI33000.1 glycosyltransferase [Lacticaseibacillus zeae]